MKVKNGFFQNEFQSDYQSFGQSFGQSDGQSDGQGDDRSGGQSDFQTILENKLTGLRSTRAVNGADCVTGHMPGHMPDEQSRKENLKETKKVAGQDFIDVLSSFFFNQGPVKQSIFPGNKSKAGFYSEPKASPSQKQRPQQETKESEGNERFNPSSACPSPKIRAKRLRTFDQVKAISVFIQFGEKEITNDATDEEIKTAYRRLAKKFHPDAGAKNDLNFKIISSAYRKLIF